MHGILYGNFKNCTHGHALKSIFSVVGLFDLKFKMLETLLETKSCKKKHCAMPKKWENLKADGCLSDACFKLHQGKNASFNNGGTLGF